MSHMSAFPIVSNIVVGLPGVWLEKTQTTVEVELPGRFRLMCVSLHHLLIYPGNFGYGTDLLPAGINGRVPSTGPYPLLASDTAIPFLLSFLH